MVTRPCKVLPGLHELAKFYRGFLFDLDGLSTSSLHERGVIRAAPIGCVRELLRRGKQVGIINGTACRSQAVLARSQSGGLPQGMQAWTSGEFVHRSLSQSRLNSEFPSSLVDRAHELMPFVGASQQNLRVFELSSIATPRRWSDLAKRGGPPLSDLENSKVIRRASSVEEADVCYWDVHEGDDLGVLLDATLELCVEYQVPMLYPGRKVETIKLLEGWGPRDSAEAAAASLLRRGGKVYGVSKFEAWREGLGWSDDISPRDVLVVTPDLGDVAEAAEMNMDALLLLGTRVEAQLAAYADSVTQRKNAARRHMSVSQRMVEDSPGMMAAYQNPFTAVFRLPGLIADANRKNAKHRERLAAAEAASKNISPPIQKSSENKLPDQLSLEDTLELLAQWCDALNVRSPAGVMSAPVAWDVAMQRDDGRPTSQKEEMHSSVDMVSRAAATVSKQSQNRKQHAIHPPQSVKSVSKEDESLDDLLQKFSTSSSKPS